MASGTATRGAGRAQSLAIAAALAVATAALYAPVLHFDFVLFDDPRYVSENERVRSGLGTDTLLWSLSSVVKSNWHPLTLLSHALDVELFGLDPAGHHATNALLHALNTALLFGVLLGLTGRAGRSATVAALFGLHPLHVESVAWVSERKDVLSTFFGLLCLWTWVRFVQEGKARWKQLSLGLFALSLLAKPMLVTLPFVLLLLDYWPLRRTAAAGGGGRRWRDLVLEKDLFFALSLAAGSVAMLAQSAAGATFASGQIAFGLRLANAAVSYARYLGMTFWPADLAVHYPHPYLPEAGGTPLAGWVVAGAACLLLLISVLVWRLRRQRYLVVGWLWYLGMLVPVIGILQVGTQALADRYTYLPLVGIFLALTWGACDAAERCWPRGRSARALLAALGAVVLGACAVTTSRHLPTWRDSVALFEQAVAVSPRDTLALNNLGNALLAQGRLDEAIASYRRALEVAPGYGLARHNLRVALALKERKARPDPSD